MLFEGQQTALDNADGGSRDITVLGLVLAGMFADMLHHGAQIFEIEQQHAVVVSNAEHQLQDAFLRVIEVQQSTQQQWPHVRNRRSHRVTCSAKHIPENNWIGLRFPVTDTHLIETLLQALRDHASRAKSG